MIDMRKDKLLQQIKKVDGLTLTKEQQSLFMKYAKESYFYNLFAVMLYTGMRYEEIRGLKYIDIDKQKDVIHVQRTLIYIKDRGYFEGPTKTQSAKRDIPLTADILELLESQMQFRDSQTTKLDDYLFCDENGEPLSKARVQIEIGRVIKRINADGYNFDPITPCVLTRTFIAQAKKPGISQ